MIWTLSPVSNGSSKFDYGATNIRSGRVSPPRLPRSLLIIGFGALAVLVWWGWLGFVGWVFWVGLVAVAGLVGGGRVFGGF